jgi:hypothetical protein
MCKDDLKDCFCKMIVVFYVINLYIYVLTIFPHPTVLYDTLTDPWYVCREQASNNTQFSYY